MHSRERERRLRRAVRRLLLRMDSGQPADPRDAERWQHDQVMARKTLELCEKDVGIR